MVADTTQLQNCLFSHNTAMRGATPYIVILLYRPILIIVEFASDGKVGRQKSCIWRSDTHWSLK